MDLRVFKIRELIENKQVVLEYCKSAHYHQGKTIGKREKGKRREKGKGKTIGKTKR